MKISVVIPLYNKRAFILRALDSVFRQTFQPEEIIVVNDGSTDDSEKIVNELNHPLVRLVKQPNAGVSAARNRGIEKASCDWIAFLDADDEWNPEFLETIKLLSATYPHCNVLATAYLLQDYKGNQNKILLNKIAFSEEHGLMKNYFEVASFSHPPLWTSAVVVRKSALGKICGFPAGVISGEDLLTWARLAVNNEIAYSIRPLSVFIQDPGHTYAERPTRVPQYPDIVGRELVLLEKQNKKIPGISNYVAHWFKMRSSIYLRFGMKKHAFIEALKSLSFRPLNLRIYIYIVLLILPVSTLNYIFRRFSNP